MTLREALDELITRQTCWPDTAIGVLLDAYRELDGALTWETTCLNCASLLDASYDSYVRAETAEEHCAALEAAIKDFLPYIHSHGYPKKKFADRFRALVGLPIPK